VKPIDPTTHQVYDYNGVQGWIPPGDLEQPQRTLSMSTFHRPTLRAIVGEDISLAPTGVPLKITTGSDKNADGYSSDGPNLIPGKNAFLSPNRNRFTSAAEWFNIDAFVANAPGQGHRTLWRRRQPCPCATTAKSHSLMT
jgi:hypothetical protein